MERSLNDILTEINNSLVSDSAFGSKLTTYELAYQQTKDEKIFPLLNQGNGQGKQIHWDDNKGLIVYHRINGLIENETDPTKGFGNNPSRTRVYPMRAVFIGTRDQLTVAGYEDNEAIARNLTNVLPSFLSGAEVIEIQEIQVNKNTVYEEEFEGVEELKTLSLDGVAFWVDYTLKGKICVEVIPTPPVATPIFVTATFGTNSINGYVDIVFNVGVYGNSAAAIPVVLSSFTHVFSQGNGEMTNWVPSSIKQNNSTVEGSAAALVGGETTIRMFGTKSGLADGQETLKLTAVNSKIFNETGQSMTTSDTITATANLETDLTLLVEYLVETGVVASPFTWADQSGNGRNMSMVQGGSDPNVLTDDINSLDTYEFDKTSSPARTVGQSTGFSNADMSGIFLGKFNQMGVLDVVLTNIINGSEGFDLDGFAFTIDSATQIGFQIRDGSAIQTILADHSDLASYYVWAWAFKSVGVGTSKLRVWRNGDPVIVRDDLDPMSPTANNFRYGGAQNGFGNSSDVTFGDIKINQDYGTNIQFAPAIQAMMAKFALSGLTTTSFTYSSSIDSITDLFCRVSYNTTLSNQPVMIILHGYAQQAADFATETLERFRGYPVFCAAVGMRGRDGASGSEDDGCREAQDVKDCIDYIRQEYRAYVDIDKLWLDGYSGGGFIVLIMDVKYPDLSNGSTAHFGISDLEAWYDQTNAANKTTIQTRVGGNPTAKPNAFRCRKPVLAIDQYQGPLYIFHDDGDSTVQRSHSDNVKITMDAAGNTNLRGNANNDDLLITTAASATRALHGLPANNGGVLINFENTPSVEYTEWVPQMLTESSKTVATSGTLEVQGYLETKRFIVELGNGTPAENRQDRSATVVYDTVANTFTLTPILETEAGVTGLDYTITHGDLTASGSITGETPTLIIPS